MTSFHLVNETVRRNCISAILNAPANWVVSIKEPTRSADANSKMWAMLSDVSKARPEGRQWTPEVWKCAFMHSLGHQVAFAEGLDGSGPFPIGFRSSKLSVRQMSDLIEVITEYGTRNGVVFSDTRNGGWME
jgi:hypothetical protein